MAKATNSTTIPDDAKKPTDRLPKAAVAEATGAVVDPVEVTLYGETFSVSPDYFDDLEVVEALEDGHLIAVLRDMLTSPGYDRLKAAIKAEHGGRAPLSALDKVFEGIMEQVGPTVKP